MTDISPLAIAQNPSAGAARQLDSRPDGGFAQTLQAVSDEPKKTEPQVAAGWRVSRKGAEVDAEINDFSWGDALDIVNPLQHLPVIGEIYRAVTGDEIRSATKITGDVLYAGLTGGVSLLGAVGSMLAEAYKEQNGQSPGMAVADALLGRNDPTVSPTLLAEAAPTTVPNALSDAAPQAAPTMPVQTASLNIPAAAQTKQPFGGVLDTGLVARNPQLAALASTPVKETRIGQVIYTSPTLTNAAQVRANALNASNAASVAPAKADQAQLAAKLALPSLGQPGERKLDSQTIGQIMHDNAQKAQLSGGGQAHSLPPALVQDMMLMALDKYKGAANLAPSEMDIR